MLTERIAGLAPRDDPLVFLTSGGSDAVDSAVKIVRRYWTLRGEPQKSGIVSRRHAYHGMHGFGTALAGIDANLAGYGEAPPDGVVHTAWDDIDAVKDAIEQVGPERLAAFFCEPVIGAGGVLPPPPGYLLELRGYAMSTPLLFIADEVITGFGRIGNWFASARFELAPTSCSGRRESPPDTRRWAGCSWAGGGRRSMTTGVVFATATRTRDTPLRARPRSPTSTSSTRKGCWPGRVGARTVLVDVFAPLADHPLVTEVRSIGLLTAVQLRDEPGLTDKVVTGAMDLGVLVRGLAGSALQISPPFVITETELGTLADVLKRALDDAVTADAPR